MGIGERIKQMHIKQSIGQGYAKVQQMRADAEKRRLEGLKRQATYLKSETEVLRLKKKRAALERGLRPRQPQAGGLFGGGMSGMDLFAPTKPAAKHKKRKKRRKTSGKRRIVIYQ